jgi:curved DNA-binding protein
VRVEYSGDLGDIFGGGGGFSDFFSQIFGNFTGAPNADPRRGGPRRTRTPKQPQAYEQEVPISLHEAYHGSARQVEIDGRKLEVNIPPGAKTGTKIRMKAAGPGGANGQRSDIYLVLNVSADPRFTRKGDDLHTSVDVDLYTAVLGGDVKVPTLEKEVVLTIPAGSQPGQSFRLRGKGMPKLKNPKERGSLFVKINVAIPKALTAEERGLYEKLAKRQK